jgi:hypothetical protein
MLSSLAWHFPKTFHAAGFLSASSLLPL